MVDSLELESLEREMNANLIRQGDSDTHLQRRLVCSPQTYKNPHARADPTRTTWVSHYTVTR